MTECKAAWKPGGWYYSRCGLTYQNMDTYNPDELHPNKFGHSLVANNDIRQMDGTVGRRYPLS